MKKTCLTLFCLALALMPAAAEDFLKGKLLRIDMAKIADERGTNSLNLSLSGLNVSRGLSLLEVERAIGEAAFDNDISMIYVDANKVGASLAAVEELRACLRQFSRSGKPVVAYTASLDNRSYYLASAADKIFLYPEGEGTLTGVATAQLFVKDLLDTLGLDVQLIRHGKFKSAGEMYIRNDISPENRLQYEEMLHSQWDTMVSGMAEARGVSADSLQAWTDALALSSAQSWLDKGLVDGLKYRDEMEQYLCHLFGTSQPKRVKTISVSDYAKKLRKGPSAKQVAVIYADGEIVRSGSGIVGSSLARTIAQVRADSTVKAVVFRVNSPGGEVVASDMIRREIELLGRVKPVVASYGGYAASGGYLISAGCRRIFTDNTTLTGSIGVFGLVITYGNALKKHLHVNPVVIGTNAHSHLGSPMEPLSAEEEAWYQERIEHIYDTFVNVVAQGRGMDKARVDSLAQGRVWTGKDAIALGLADETGTLMDAIAYAAQLAGVYNYRITAFPEKKDPLSELLGRTPKDDDHLVRMQEYLPAGFTAVTRLPYLTVDAL